MQKNIYGIIYLIKNTITNQYYIGQTTRSFNDRYRVGGGKRNSIERVYNYHKWQRDHNRYYNEYLLNSLEKYGINNFYVNIQFDIAFSQEELNIKEQLWIKYYNCIENGFNWCEGGSHGKWSEESKKKISESLKGKYVGALNPNYGKGDKIRGELNCNFNSLKLKCECCGKEILVQKKNYKKYRHHYCSVKCYNEMQKSTHKGKNNPRAKAVVCINDNYRYFDTVTECAEYYNLDKSTVIKVCKGKYKSTKGYELMYYYDWLKQNKNSEESA